MWEDVCLSFPDASPASTASGIKTLKKCNTFKSLNAIKFKIELQCHRTMYVAFRVK